MTRSFAGTKRFDPARHDTSRFDSGNETLNRWLVRYAGPSEGRDAARTFVATGNGGIVVAYYLAGGVPSGRYVERKAVQELVRSPEMARQVLASAEARSRLPQLIEELVSHPELTVDVGRHRRREVVVVAAERYDEMLEREELVRDLAWAWFAQERIEHPTSAPVSWEEAQRRRQTRR